MQIICKSNLPSECKGLRTLKHNLWDWRGAYKTLVLGGFRFLGLGFGFLVQGFGGFVNQNLSPNLLNLQVKHP